MNLPTRLPTVRVTKSFSFEASHALPSHNGPCKNIHGHSYHLLVTVSGKPHIDPSSSSDGMVIDFTDLKAIVKEHVVDVLDHTLILSAADKDRFPGIDESTRTLFLPFSPTCELLLVYICNIIARHLPSGVTLQRVRLQETATSYADWHSDDNR